MGITLAFGVSIEHEAEAGRWEYRQEEHIFLKRAQLTKYQIYRESKTGAPFYVGYDKCFER
jgi:hypothetical protein